MISSYCCKDTEELSRRCRSAKFKAVEKVALRKLRMLDAATVLDDLRFPPGNRLEPLVGNRAGQYSIRINDQFRICFVWREGNAHDVEIVDYH